ncbi:MAG: thiamine pyrophosphate-dependent dehydrogenase E1 component subunit alpha [Lentisphaerae bacterium]|nr:thiamine pyrophosphate-dependent dehydrogenase E1 component subunit alpha [Lentisphaerota bacterium]MBT4822251.1 thiamine pyrophosphate-dependent dehydrogenase E1 component subunit alpha [Lentisphaerota bacterium]MBT5606315.1 thiamine pyrophosphate-dependent dehydrogenase E1 component subunit alpha [Lentisphaerota bacterium]MBT7056388.1 thiamine pyrophosphate-dependent dehydrogenase E1 component subunit alpha [Lentisphaerota bacterium]MBT7848240.1 thiamine pyrophosphate-dependent dehydrogena
MLTIRRFEEEVKTLYRAGEIVGAIHLYIGQEAVAVGACEALRTDDYVTSGHRSHGHTLAKHLDVKTTMAEMMGRATGHSKGRGGSMHMFDIKKGFLGGNGIVGGGISIALGAAFSAKYRSTDQVCVCFFSEGASNQGVIHECLNMASLWGLPIIYLCENNRYAATTPVEKSTCTEDIAPRADAYNLPWAICDGNDVLDVHRTVSAAVTRARTGGGCTFIEAKTYRVEPHCGIIPDARGKDEILDWRGDARDPIERFRRHARDDGLLSAADLRNTESAVESELEEAIAFARESPFPDPEHVAEYLWA